MKLLKHIPTDTVCQLQEHQVIFQNHYLPKILVENSKDWIEISGYSLEYEQISSIERVHRSFDNVSFQIGDVLKHLLTFVKIVNIIKNNNEIVFDVQSIFFEPHRFEINLYDACKATPIFKTKDEVNIYSNNTCIWAVALENIYRLDSPINRALKKGEIITCRLRKMNKEVEKSFAIFSSCEACQKYVIEQTPTLSYNEVIEFMASISCFLPNCDKQSLLDKVKNNFTKL